jgi:hypothetical protein
VFNFRDLYKNYSNIELLKIVRQPGVYEASAIEAASSILTGRDVSEDDMEEVDNFIRDVNNEVQKKQRKKDAISNQAADFFEPILAPTEEVKPSKWLNMFLLLLTLQYAREIYRTIKHFVRYLKCLNCDLDFYIFLDFISLIYIPVIFYLLFKRKRWGWILLFADNLLSLILQLSQSYIFFKIYDIHHQHTLSFIEPIVIKALFTFFLWRNAIAEHFGITRETKKNTALVTTALAITFIIAVNIIGFFLT